MKKYLCTVCGHIYDEDAGDEKHDIAEKTAFELLPDKWTCPVCGAFKSQFRELNAPKIEIKVETKSTLVSSLFISLSFWLASDRVYLSFNF